MAFVCQIEKGEAFCLTLLTKLITFIEHFNCVDFEKRKTVRIRSRYNANAPTIVDPVFRYFIPTSNRKMLRTQDLHELILVQVFAKKFRHFVKRNLVYLVIQVDVIDSLEDH